MYLRKPRGAICYIAALSAVLVLSCSGERTSEQMLQVRLFKNAERSIELFSGSAVARGDELYMTVLASRPMYVYIISADSGGDRSIIHPCRNWGRSRPLRAGIVHRLPTPVLGQGASWLVQSVTLRERLTVLSSAHPIDILEAAVIAREGSRPCAVTLDSDESNWVNRLTDELKPVAVPQQEPGNHPWKIADGNQEMWVATFDLRGNAS